MAALRVLLSLLVLIISVNGQYDMYQCPFGWEDEGEYCYRFVQEHVPITDARKGCLELGQSTFLLSINSDFEHSFIVRQLNDKYDKGSRKRDWWTSGRRLGQVGNETDQFFWTGDGRPIESQYYWHNRSVTENKAQDKILYNYNGTRWGWILGVGTENRPFICKISKEDIYYISDVRRGPDYGSNQTVAAKIPRGPRFIEQPQDVLFEVSLIDMPDDLLESAVSFTCLADAYPPPKYSWFKERTELEEPIDVMVEPRYSLVGGKLVINDASEQLHDVGNYWCKAENEYGSILSSRAQLEFGFIGDFSKDPRSDVKVSMHKEAIIDCSPPDPVPENSPIIFEWYVGEAPNQRYVRTETKYYIFNSWDGKLYFSEVTQDDTGTYSCKISRPGYRASSGAISPSINLVVEASSPGEYEPTILSGFPRVYPSNPKVNMDIRIECFAAGSSDPPLSYIWRRRDADGNDIVLPTTHYLEDHNRVLNLRHVQIYDAGTYSCTVNRHQGMSDSKEVNLHLAAEPFFMVELEDRFIDMESDLKWRCEADGLPQPDYKWLKNGRPILSNNTEGIVISQNVLIIKGADPKLHNGMYQCAASNTYAIKYSSAELRVIKFAPSFSKLPLQINQFATLRGNATIMCQPEAAPKPKVTWYKNGRLLNPGTEEGAHYRQMANGNLYINDVRQDDEGVYRCNATNSMGTASSTGNLTVLDTVTISTPPYIPPNGVHINKTSVLHCIASYNPQLDVTYVWHQNDMLIDFEKIYRLSESNYRVWRDPHFKRGTGYYLGALYIMNAQPSQVGRYTCTVESTNGAKISRHVDIEKVLGPPFEPAGVYILPASNTTTSVDIQFIPAGAYDEGALKITSYVIESYNFWQGFWKIHETNVVLTKEVKPGTKRHTIKGLRPFTIYKFRVRAENKFGTSQPSDPTGEITTGSVKPDLYPEQVGGGGGKQGELRISWKPMKPWERNGKKFSYHVFWKPEGDSDPDQKHVEVSGDASYTSIVVGKKNFYRPYDVSVQAVNEKGVGPKSPQVTIRSAMRLPDIVAQNVQIQPYNSTACIVNWEPVMADREKIGGVLGGYRVAYWDREKYGKEVMEDASRVTINGQVNQAMVIGLDPDTMYMFGVYVWNEAGNGPISDPFAQRTLRQAPINQPVEVKVYQLSQTSIRVFFRGVSTTNQEEPLIGYKVRLWHGGLNIKRADDYNAKKEIDFVIRGLNPEILYKLRVFGYSRGGEGTMSSPAVEFKLGAAGHLKASGAVVFVLALVTLLRTYL